MSKENVQILIAEDDIFIRRNIVHSLIKLSGFSVAGEVSGGLDAVEFVNSHPVDLIIMDIEMDTSNDGLTAAESISLSHPQISIIMLTVKDDEHSIYDSYCIRSVRDYIVKSTDNNELIAAIHRTVEERRKAISANQKLREEFQRLKKNEASLLYAFNILTALTPSEKEIITLKLKGLSNHQISRIRMVEDGTIRAQITVLLKKMGYSRTSQIIDLIKELKLEHFFGK